MMTNDDRRGHTLGSTMLRVGILAVLRSKKLDGRTIGVMITASHNPAEVSMFFSVLRDASYRSLTQADT
jgi:phosphomannomutase